MTCTVCKGRCFVCNSCGDPFCLNYNHNVRVTCTACRGRAEGGRAEGARKKKAPSVSTTDLHQLIEHANYETLEKIYKLVMLDVHPDRGGSTEQAQTVNVAWAEIKRRSPPGKKYPEFIK